MSHSEVILAESCNHRYIKLPDWCIRTVLSNLRDDHSLSYLPGTSDRLHWRFKQIMYAMHVCTYGFSSHVIGAIPVYCINGIQVVPSVTGVWTL